MYLALDPALRLFDAPGGTIGITSDTGLKFENLRVFLQPETEFPTGSLVGNLRADGTFTLHNVLPERYSPKVFGVPQIFYISALELGNQPVEGRVVDFSRGVAPLHIFLGREGGVLTGSVLRDQDQPVSGAKVVLVPNGTNAAAHDLYKAVASARDGRCCSGRVHPFCLGTRRRRGILRPRLSC